MRDRVEVGVQLQSVVDHAAGVGPHQLLDQVVGHRAQAQPQQVEGLVGQHKGLGAPFHQLVDDRTQRGEGRDEIPLLDQGHQLIPLQAAARTAVERPAGNLLPRRIDILGSSKDLLEKQGTEIQRQRKAAKHGADAGVEVAVKDRRHRGIARRVFGVVKRWRDRRLQIRSRARFATAAQPGVEPAGADALPGHGRAEYHVGIPLPSPIPRLAVVVVLLHNAIGQLPPNRIRAPIQQGRIGKRIREVRQRQIGGARIPALDPQVRPSQAIVVGPARSAIQVNIHVGARHRAPVGRDAAAWYQAHRLEEARLSGRLGLPVVVGKVDTLPDLHIGVEKIAEVERVVAGQIQQVGHRAWGVTQ